MPGERVGPVAELRHGGLHGRALRAGNGLVTDHDPGDGLLTDPREPGHVVGGRTASLAFGFGRHSCLGLQITEHECRALYDVLLSDWPGWTFDGEPKLEWLEETIRDTTVKVLDDIAAVPIKTGG